MSLFSSIGRERERKYFCLRPGGLEKSAHTASAPETKLYIFYGLNIMHHGDGLVIIFSLLLTPNSVSLFFRYQHVRWKQKDMLYFTQSQAKRFIFSFTVLSIVYHLPQVWNDRYQDDAPMGDQSLLQEPITPYKLYHVFHFLLFDRIVLLIAILGLIIFLSCDLCRHKKQFKTIDFIVTTDNGRARDITRIVVVSSWISIFLSLPHALYESTFYFAPQVTKDIFPPYSCVVAESLRHLISAVNFFYLCMHFQILSWRFSKTNDQVLH